MQITRDIVSDLWPVYASGEASADTRALVDAFLADDPEFASTLKREADLPPVDIALSPDEEARTLARTREAIRGGPWLRGVRLVALTLTILAIIRFKADSTENFWARVVVAAIAWSLYGLLAWRQRRRTLRTTTPPRHA
jgi:anti-sigma factor RsiW